MGGTKDTITRRHLLDAAGEVFAAKGFRNATVREICRRAGTNVASVKYHFGDKESLYSEVLTHLNGLAQERFPITLDLPPDASPAERLHAFVRSLLRRVLSTDLAARHGRLMAREMVDPTRALDRLVNERIRPEADALRTIITGLCAPGTDAGFIQATGLSVVGQILFYSHCAPVLERLFPGEPFGVTRLERLADHITTFTLGAIEALNPAHPIARRTPGTGPRKLRSRPCSTSR